MQTAQGEPGGANEGLPAWGQETAGAVCLGKGSVKCKPQDRESPLAPLSAPSSSLWGAQARGTPGTPGWGRRIPHPGEGPPAPAQRLHTADPTAEPLHPSHPPGWRVRGRRGGLAPEPPLSAVGLGFPHSWEPSVGFCWQTERSFHVKRLVQYVSSYGGDNRV